MAPKALPSRSVPSAVMKMMVPRVVKAKMVAAGTALLEDTPCDFPVTLDVNQRAALGADLEASSDGKTLLVRSLSAFSDWNRLHPLLTIQKNDRVIAVNHRNDAQAMLTEIRVAGVLRLMVRSIRRTNSTLKDESKRRLEDDSHSLYGGMPAPDPQKVSVPTKDIFADPPAKEDPSLAVFLDIDGVLRKLENVPTITVNGGTLPLDLGNRALLPEALRALKYLVHVTGASIIISSEWRRSTSLLEEAQTALRALGLRVKGVTPVLRPQDHLFVGGKLDPDKQGTLRLRWAERRAREITTWLQDHPEVRQWLALDDLDLNIADDVRHPDTLKMGPSLMLIDPEVGLTMSHARQATERLLKKERPWKMART